MADDCRGAGCGSIFLSFVMGAAIGGGLALLTAPRSGKETREKVLEMGDDVRDRVKKIVEEAEARIKEVVEEGQEAFEEKRDVVKSAIAAGKEAMATEQAKHKKTA